MARVPSSKCGLLLTLVRKGHPVLPLTVSVVGVLFLLLAAVVTPCAALSDVSGVEPEFFRVVAKQTRNLTNSVISSDDYDNGTDITTSSSSSDLPPASLYKAVLFEVQGKNLYPQIKVKVTRQMAQRNSQCQDVDFAYNITEIIANGKWGQYELTLPQSVTGTLYLCLPHKVKETVGFIKPNLLDDQIYNWYNQGPQAKIVLEPVDKKQIAPLGTILHEHRLRREENSTAPPPNDLPPEFPPVAVANKIRIKGIRFEGSNKEPTFEDGTPEVLSNYEHKIRLFGEGFSESMTVTFTPEPGGFGENCYLPVVKGFAIDEGSLFGDSSVLVTINLPPSKTGDLFICVKAGPIASTEETFRHQGSEPWLKIRTYEKLMPLWAQIIVILICLIFSCLMSGLNLGLMSLDKTELKILCNTGSAKERQYARTIQPVRDHGNYLLCSILLGNTLVNSSFTILLDDLTSGLIAVIFSTLAIVFFGEIFPQAVCSRHGLAVGAKTIYITKFVMIITFPLSFTIAKVLDWILGEEIGNVYTRERLKELIQVTTGENDLDKDEVNIISGALELRKKTVADVMTKIEDVFMLDYDAVLDFETVSEIMKSGYSRIPVYDGNRQNIVTMLYIKDLAFVDPDDNTPLKTLCQFYQNPCNFVFEDVTLDVMFKIFKEGNKGHMAFVSRVNNEGEGDPYYETIGLITLEDVIEELIQSEIVDETDVFTDNRTKRRRKDAERKDFSIFADKKDQQSKVRMSPQLTLAAYQYLSTSVEPFQSNVISETILRRLLKQDIVFHVRKNKEWKTDPTNVIYSQGKPVDYFVIILEGRVEVTVGKENLVFEGGPFTYFGTQALVQTVGIVELSESPAAPQGMGSLESLNIDSMLRHTFVPDYSVRATTEVLYLKIKRSLYLAAKRATLMERSKRDQNQTKEQMDEEIDKMLHSMDEDDISSGGVTPRRKSSRNLAALTQPIQTQKDLQEHINSLQSPKTPSHFSNASPTNRLGSRSGDINGSLKNSPIDDESADGRGEEVSLLPKKS